MSLVCFKNLYFLLYYSEQKVDVPTKVYVGGIPYYSTEDDIRSYFEGCGTITEIDCMTFPETGKFRGIALISFKVRSVIFCSLFLLFPSSSFTPQ